MLYTWPHGPISVQILPILLGEVKAPPIYHWVALLIIDLDIWPTLLPSELGGVLYYTKFFSVSHLHNLLGVFTSAES